MSQELHSATYSRITYEDFGEDFVGPSISGSDDDDLASAVYTAVEELLLDEVDTDPQAKCVTGAAPSFAFTDAIAQDLLTAVSTQLEQIKTEIREDQLRVATFLASAMMRVVDTLATEPSIRPEPVALPRMLALMQGATRSQAPIEISASGQLYTSLERMMSDDDRELMRVNAQESLCPGEVTLTWGGNRASWRPDLVLLQMIEIMRQFGLYTNELEESDHVR